MADWVTISSLATAGGTLVLATATFASVRSGNRTARIAEESLLTGIRPLLMHSRPEDPAVKAGFRDGHWVMVPGGCGTAEASDEGVYLTMSLRNVGAGIAVMHGWHLEPTSEPSPDRPALEAFHRLTRDLYVGAGEVGFWQGALRDAEDMDYDIARKLIAARERLLIDVLYGDHQGGQRVITRFSMTPRTNDDGWLAAAGRHWNLDRADPR